MEGFKTLAKGVKCYKEGGSVYKSRHSEKSEQKSDIKQDKAIVKKAFAMHDKQEHKGEKTDLSKLKKGGRTKKTVGTVKKYKAGGDVTNVYEAKKTSGDKDNIRKTKLIKPTKAAAPSAPINNLKGVPLEFKKGGKIKKMQYGGMTAPAPAGIPAAAPSGAMGQVSELEKRRQMEKMARAKKYLSPSQQGELISQDPTAAGLPAVNAPLMRKKGGKIKKYATGGSIDEDVRERARKWMEAGSPPQPTGDAETPTKSAPKKAAKLPMPDYSNEDLDRMGMNKDIKQPEFDREENSPWMREYRKEEAKTAEKTRRSKRTPRQMLQEESEYTIKPNLQVKGERLMKGFGMKRGGRACK